MKSTSWMWERPRAQWSIRMITNEKEKQQTVLVVLKIVWWVLGRWGILPCWFFIRLFFFLRFILIRLRRSKTWSVFFFSFSTMRMQWAESKRASDLYICVFISRYNFKILCVKCKERSVFAMKRQSINVYVPALHAGRRERVKKNPSSPLFSVCQSFPMTTIKKMHCMKTSKLWLYKSYIIY